MKLSSEFSLLFKLSENSVLMFAQTACMSTNPPDGAQGMMGRVLLLAACVDVNGEFSGARGKVSSSHSTKRLIVAGSTQTHSQL